MLNEYVKILFSRLVTDILYEKLNQPWKIESIDADLKTALQFIRVI